MVRALRVDLDQCQPHARPPAVVYGIAAGGIGSLLRIRVRDGCAGAVVQPCRQSWYNDFDIDSTHLSSPASTNAATAVRDRVVVITLLDGPVLIGARSACVV